MKTKIKKLAFTLIELLVVISIIAILAALAIPGVTGALTRGQLVQALNNARQTHLAVITAALDVATTGSGLGWPGTTYATAPLYCTALVAAGVVKQGDTKIFTTVGFTNATTATIATPNIGFKFYNVDEADEGNVVFLTTKNLTYAGSATTAPTAAAKPFGQKGFVVFRKGGDGTFYKQAQYNDTNNLGALPAAATAVMTD